MDIEFIPAAEDCYHTPGEAQVYYGTPRVLQTIVLHWWNRPANRPDFRQNLNYLLNPPKKYPTANTVIGYDPAQGRVRIIDTVKYPNVAFTTGGRINAQSVGIECDPYLIAGQPNHAEVLKAVGYRVWQYRVQAGWRVPLSLHKNYTPTECSDIDLALVDRESDRWASGAYNPQPAQPSTPPTIKYVKLDTPKVYVTKKQPTNLWNFGFPKQSQMTVQQPFGIDKQITVFGYAEYPVGTGIRKYLMTKYSFGNANEDGTPDHTWGFNEVDLAEYIAPLPVPEPTPTPVPVPTPQPEPTAVPIPPFPTDPIPGETAQSFLKRMWTIIWAALAKFKFWGN